MEKLKLRKCELKSCSSFIAFDVGTILIKGIYVDKQDDSYNIDDKNNDITFTCLMNERSCGIARMVEHIKLFKSNLECFQSKTVMLSGLQCERYISEINNILTCDVKIIDEMEAIANGMRYIIDGEEKDFIQLPEIIPPMAASTPNKIVQKLIDNMKSRIQSGIDNSEEKIYPILYVSGGSVTRFIVINRNGKGREISLNTFGGKTTLGLIKCLLDENNFHDLVCSAEKGNRANVDTQIKDVLGDIESSPYGNHSPDRPLFPFGKAMDVTNNVVLTYKPDDMCQSLVSMILENCVLFGYRISLSIPCKSIYFGGNLFQHKSFLVEYAKFNQRMPEIAKCYFMKGGNEANIGLLLWKNKTSRS